MKSKVLSLLAAFGLFIGVLACAARPVVTAVSVNFDEIPVPIFLYHHVTEKSSYWGRDSISPAELESDLQMLTEYGYTTVSLAQVIDYVRGKGNLPPKAVVLTFDDGFLNYRDVVVPLLEKYNCRATLAIVGEYADNAENRVTDNPNFEYMTWEEAASLDPCVTELAYHSYSSHQTNDPATGRRGMKKRAGESNEEYGTYLMNEWEAFSHKAEEYGISCRVTAYPFGSYSDTSDALLSSLGIEATLTCESGVNHIRRGEGEVLFGLKRTNRPHGVDSEAFFKKYLTMG